MKKIAVITLLLPLALLFVETANSQQVYEFAPVGAEWYYTRIYKEGFNPTGIACDRFTSLRTVNINGLECKEIELYQHLDCDGIVNPHSELRYAYQDGDLVYEVEDGELYLLYDFSKEPGEYWVSTKYDVTVFVTNISYITLDDGSTRRVLETTTSDSYCWFGNVIEGIGREESLFPQYQLDGAPCLEGPIRCYFENGIPLISSETDCDYEVESVDEYDMTPSVFANTLVEDVLHVSFADNLSSYKTIKIYDITGKMVYEAETTSKSIDISFDDKPDGVYLLRVSSLLGIINIKIVKR